MEEQNLFKKYFKFFIISSLLVVIGFSIFRYIEVYLNIGSQNLPRKAFTLIKTKSKFKICNLGRSCIERIKSSSGSGAVIFKDKKRNKIFILTAAHICDSKIKIQKPLFVSRIELNIEITDINNVAHKTKIVNIDHKYDLCLLSSIDDKNIFDVANLSSKMPKIGERVYNLSAPLGFFSKNLMLIFEGFYSGRSSRGNEIFTIPTKPGSSGSLVFNKYGLVVAMIHSGIRNIENISITTGIYEIIPFLKTSMLIEHSTNLINESLK